MVWIKFNILDFGSFIMYKYKSFVGFAASASIAAANADTDSDTDTDTDTD